MSAPKDDRDGILQAIEAVQGAGWQLHCVNDGEGTIAVCNPQAAVKAVMQVDQAWIYFNKGEDNGWLFIVLGNDPDEVVCDYTTNLDPAISDLQESWFA